MRPEVTPDDTKSRGIGQWVGNDACSLQQLGPLPEKRFILVRKMKGFRIRKNGELRGTPTVNVIGEDGGMLGAMTLAEALRKAVAAGLDLVEVNPKSDPPVCKLLDFSKYKYEVRAARTETLLTRGAILNLARGESLAARRPAKRPDHTAWVGVYPQNRSTTAYLNSVDKESLGLMTVRTYEVPDAYLSDAAMANDIDHVMVDVERFTVDGARELEALLIQLGVDPATLSFGSETSYPL